MHTVYAAADPAAQDAAIAAMQKMVDAGDAEAAFRLGRYYHLESGEPDYTLALKYYQLAADANHAWATNNLGLLYRDGLGVARNTNQAHEYFQKAAHQNNPWAYVNLAEMAFGERGAPDAAAKGIALLEEGARNTCTLCLIEEASIYHSGAHGIRADSAKTVWLLHKAAALGDNQNLGYLFDKGCSPIARDDHHALQIYLLCAKLGVALCQNNVGAMIKHGRGVPTADPARGYGWIKLAALHGNDLAKANLGDPLFTASVRAVGLANLSDIQRRPLAVPADPREIQRDPWY
jgi:uncharacterized protein